ncbi:hypothetical protein DQ04_01611140 [Trypanosoma grayi]|uniref:hypothetical protein n=1 Tax=Trypanosoma grayi TaxID=71804 RepID=UPI0004F4B06C|nr:hypothetical protein DQ04_01611140 [Trypanosoma grayi]KEG12572.1 hypothetical protein DQ04_01611140 [Trypanosoma grayi]
MRAIILRHLVLAPLLSLIVLLIGVSAELEVAPAPPETPAFLEVTDVEEGEKAADADENGAFIGGAVGAENATDRTPQQHLKLSQPLPTEAVIQENEAVLPNYVFAIPVALILFLFWFATRFFKKRWRSPLHWVQTAQSAEFSKRDAVVDGEGGNDEAQHVAVGFDSASVIDNESHVKSRKVKQ